MMTFRCPKCQGIRLEEVWTGVNVTAVLAFINEEGDHDYEERQCDDGELYTYRCVACGYELKDANGATISDALELVEWLKENVKQEPRNMPCKFCESTTYLVAHIHQGGAVCDQCWDERLQSTS